MESFDVGRSMGEWEGGGYGKERRVGLLATADARSIDAELGLSLASTSRPRLYMDDIGKLSTHASEPFWVAGEAGVGGGSPRAV